MSEARLAPFDLGYDRIMAARTDNEVTEAIEADRRHLQQWRATPEGEAEYQAAVERAKVAAERLRAAG